MITTDQISEIFATYKKHGWLPRRVLLTKNTLKNLGTLDDEVSILESDIDAAWFSRPLKPGGIAWEIRYLGETPFALLENLDEDDPDFEEKLRDIEVRLKKSVASKRN